MLYVFHGGIDGVIITGGELTPPQRWPITMMTADEPEIPGYDGFPSGIIRDHRSFHVPPVSTKFCVTLINFPYWYTRIFFSPRMRRSSDRLTLTVAGSL